MTDEDMMPMSLSRMQEMQRGYQERIDRQKAAITRLQLALTRQAEWHKAEMDRLREEGLRLQEQVSQLAAEAKNLRALIDVTHADAPDPTDPHSTPAEWHRVVPVPASGPSTSPGQEVLPFDAFDASITIPGEQAPAKTI